MHCRRWRLKSSELFRMLDYVKRRKLVRVQSLAPGGFIYGFRSSALNSLQGALGKTSGRSYKAAPRQLLQVDSASSANSDHAADGDSAGADLARNLNGASADVSTSLVLSRVYLTRTCSRMGLSKRIPLHTRSRSGSWSTCMNSLCTSIRTGGRCPLRRTSR
jgi:hypothetical protein